MKNKYLVCVPLCIIAIIARTKLKNDVDIVMALINVAAFLFVVYFAYNDMIIKANEKINSIIAISDTINKKYRKKKFLNGFFVLVICVIFASIYILKYTCSLGNDAIAIIALGLSVISDEVSDRWSEILFRRIQKKVNA